MDGYDPITKTVYEFHGCEFHGCKKCKQNNRHSKTFHHPDRTFEEMYQATQRKIDLLHAAGYKVIDIWECDFKKELKENKTLMDLVKKYDLDRPPRSKKCILWETNGDGKMFSQSRRKGADSI